MYVRIARFEGLDAARVDEQIAARKAQMDAARASGALPEGAPEQVRTLRQTVTRVYELLDREQGVGLGLTFCATADDMRRADAALNEMSPDEGEGRRTGVEIFEVVLDEDFS